MSRRWSVPVVLSLVSILASIATLTVAAGGSGTLSCPGSAAASIIDCGAVISSAGGHILGLPLGFWGLVWVAVYWLARLLFPRRIAHLIPALGFLGVAYAIGTELRVGHICAWCSLDQAAIVSLAIWTLATAARPEREGYEPQG